MKFEYSAGGIVYRKKENKTLILVAKHSMHHGWVFPKGLIGDKEDNKNQSKEETAVREVKEEAGIIAEIEVPITPVEFFYTWNEEKIKKTVYYFVMKYLGGDITNHDDEMEEVEFINSDDVFDRLTYESDKSAWKDARGIIGL